MGKRQNGQTSISIWQHCGVSTSTDAANSETCRLRIDLGYDGSDFHGWAKQPGLRTVQGELERALAVLLRVPSEDVTVVVGGRTDAGVHARGQVAHLDVARISVSRVTARRLHGVLRRFAPDIVVHDVSSVPPEFDARFSALRRRYEYRVRSSDTRRDPLTSRYTVELSHTLDLDAMQRASHSLLGLRDFTTFCKARDGATAVRTLIDFTWRETEDGALAARIEADAFCHSMVRALTGAVVAVGAGRLTQDDLDSLADARERTSRFSVLPAHGLSLEEIVYPEADELASRAHQTRARRGAIDRPVLPSKN